MKKSLVILGGVVLMAGLCLAATFTCSRCKGSCLEPCPTCGSPAGRIGQVRCSVCKGSGMFNGFDCICIGGVMDCSSCTWIIDRTLCRRCGGRGTEER